MSVDSQQIERAWLDPNRIWSIGPGVAWQGLSGSVSVRTGASVDDSDLYGETHYSDIQFQLYGKKLGFDSFFQSYEGYFLRDLPASCERGQACSLRRELEIEHAGLVAYYVLDPRWSMRAAFSPPDRQMHSAGSWFLSAGFNLLAIDNDGALVEGLSPPIDSSRLFMASVAPGYGYTWVREKWFIASAFYLGGGPVYASYSTAEDNTDSVSGWELALKAGFKLGAGYRGDTWQAGIHALADSPYVQIEGVELQWVAQTVEIYTGRRF